MFEGTAGSNNREPLLKGCLSYSLVPLYKLLLVNLNEGRKAMLFIVYISGYMPSSIIVHSICALYFRRNITVFEKNPGIFCLFLNSA